MPTFQNLINQASKLIKARRDVTNKELQTYLQCNEEVLRLVRSQLICEGHAVEYSHFALRSNEVLKKELQADIFISYAHTDASIADTIVDKLHQIHSDNSPFPLRLFLDKESIRTMEYWEKKLVRELRAAKIIANLISPAYFKSEYCKKEWEQFQQNNISRALPGENSASVYISTAQEYEQNMDNELIKNLKKYQYLDVRIWNFSQLTTEQERLFIKFYYDITDKIVSIERHLAIKIKLPLNNPNFTGRSSLLEELHQKITVIPQEQIVALYGLSGTGKTSIALQYAYTQKSYYKGGCYQARIPETGGLKDAIIRLADDLEVDITGQKNLDDQYRAVLQKLEEGESTLLIFDNVVEIEPFQKIHQNNILPRNPNVHILMTTQCSKDDLEKAWIHPIEVSQFSEKESLTLLSQFKVFTDLEEEEAAKKIHAFTEGLPIAIEMIGSYIWKNISYTEYYEKLNENKIPALDLAAQDGKQLAIHDAKLFSVLFADLQDRLDVHENLIIEFACYLSHDHIPKLWLFDLYSKIINLVSGRLKSSGKEQLYNNHQDYLSTQELTKAEEQTSLKTLTSMIEWLENNLESLSERFEKAIRRLEGFQLLSKASSQDVFRMHHLVKLCLIAQKEKSGQPTMAGEMVFDYIFSKCEQMSKGEIALQNQNRKELLPLMGYFEFAVPRWGDRCWGAIFAVAQHYLTTTGDILFTKSILELAYKYVITPLGKRKIALLLKQFYYSLGDKEGCERINVDEGKEFESLFPREWLLSSKILEFGILVNEGKNDEAIAMGEQLLLEIEEADLSQNKESALTIKNNLAILYVRKNRMDECIRYSLECVQLSEDLYPNGSLTLAIRYNNLAAHYSLISNFERAIEFAEKAERLYQKLNLNQTEGYAINLKQMAAFNRDNLEARDLTLKALKIMINIYGERSPKLSDFYNQLARCEYMLANYESAYVEIDKAIDIIIQLSGNNHPDLLTHYLLKLQIHCDWHSSKTYQSWKEEQAKRNNIPQFFYDIPAVTEESYYMFEIERIVKINNLSEDTIFFAQLYATMGRTYLLSEKIEEAVFSFAAAIKIFEALKLDDKQLKESVSKFLFNTVSNRFEKIYSAGKILESFKFLFHCYQILSSTLGESHDLTLNVYVNLMEIQSHHMELLSPEVQVSVKKYMAVRHFFK